MRFFWKATLVVFISISTATAQSPKLILSTSKNLSIQYQVRPKETLYSLSRRFYVHPRHLASFNKIAYDKGLRLGQTLLIPLTDTNFSKTNKKGLPVYRPFSGKQKKVIAGYLIKNEFTETEMKNRVEGVIPTAPQDSGGNSLGKALADNNLTSNSAPDIPPVIPALSSPSDSLGREEGYFKEAFTDQTASVATLMQLVKSGYFKTISGWQDGKYYLLTNLANPGTYAKLYCPSTQKTVFAKVLGDMSAIRQNEGYDIRISQAAAAALGLRELDLFTLELHYSPIEKR